MNHGLTIFHPSSTIVITIYYINIINQSNNHPMTIYKPTSLIINHFEPLWTIVTNDHKPSIDHIPTIISHSHALSTANQHETVRIMINHHSPSAVLEPGELHGREPQMYEAWCSHNVPGCCLLQLVGYGWLVFLYFDMFQNWLHIFSNAYTIAMFLCVFATFIQII